MARRSKEAVQAANIAARKALSSGKRADADHLGDLAWWDGSPRFRKPCVEVAKAFTDHGLDAAATLPAPPSYVVAFGRAVAATRASIASDDYELKDAAPGPAGERRIAIARIGRNGRVTLDDQGTVTCPTETAGGAPFIERRDPAGVAEKLMACVQTYVDHYTSDDVRTAVVDTFERWQAMPCRVQPPHVVYWAPPQAGETLRKLSDAIVAIGWGRVELFAGYASDARSAQAVTHAVNEGLEAKLAAFGAEAREFAAADPLKTRASSIANRIAQAAELREQAALYRSILGAAVTAIDGRVADVERELRRTLGVVENAKEAAKRAR